MKVTREAVGLMQMSRCNLALAWEVLSTPRAERDAMWERSVLQILALSAEEILRSIVYFENVSKTPDEDELIDIYQYCQACHPLKGQEIDKAHRVAMRYNGTELQHMSFEVTEKMVQDVYEQVSDLVYWVYDRYWQDVLNWCSQYLVTAMEIGIIESLLQHFPTREDTVNK